MVSAPTMTRDLRYKVLFESLVTSIAGRLARERLLTTLNVLGLMWRRESLCYVKHLRFNAARRSRRNSYHYTYGKRLRFNPYRGRTRTLRLRSKRKHPIIRLTISRIILNSWSEIKFSIFERYDIDKRTFVMLMLLGTLDCHYHRNICIQYF